MTKQSEHHKNTNEQSLHDSEASSAAHQSRPQSARKQSTKQQSARHLSGRHSKLTGKLVIAVIGMFGFGFALVPIYDVMCDALGINGKTNTVSAIQPKGMEPDTSRLIRVEFMAHINQDMPWQFEPEKSVMEVHPGQVIQTKYYAKNTSSSALVGQAVPSVAPGMGATYFNKIECFCFNQQPLDGLAQAEMPLIFYIEPDIPTSIHTLTLSYTLYNITEPDLKVSGTKSEISEKTRASTNGNTNTNVAITTLAHDDTINLASSDTATTTISKSNIRSQ